MLVLLHQLRIAEHSTVKCVLTSYRRAIHAPGPLSPAFGCDKHLLRYIAAPVEQMTALHIVCRYAAQNAHLAAGLRRAPLIIEESALAAHVYRIA